ncbi:enoyl-ACP reductase FabI [Candidatus Bandiella euplotis]|uniref:Enoyl-[acyl-carrier-protein] reductase [NADH] n=1 Tax=Candidatus Bandiella euplotis TaxID=1664265 RepID=A0ABZ0UQ85_9RICK|nr:SDR family oxidoreductase [Candidatus Bandiella woodruffii]WPX96868.1 Enoyl-[acyl-carrier-protein] reductase [NADH] FabI [Candidatus Bandiella woodruffii]
MKSLLSGKVGLIMGLANDRSIAWGIAKACHAHGAKLAITYQSEIFEKRVRPLADELQSDTLIECDATNPESVDGAFKMIKDKHGQIDFFIHAIAFSDKEELKGRYVDTSRANFLNTLDVSCYSFVYTSKKAAEILSPNGSILTLTYYGAEKVIPNYNVMGVAKAALEASVKYIAADLGELGIRVNSISAGPIKTLAASGIGDFRSMLKFNEENSPLRRNVTIHDIGNAAVYLASDLSSSVTGEIMHVDAGYNVIGAPKNLSGNS